MDNIEVVKSRLVESVMVLDAFLTDKDSKQAAHTAKQLTDPLDFVFGSLYYLSDGGYSRVFWSEWQSKLCIASESRNEVKSKWSLATKEINNINDLCRQLITLLEAE